MGSESVVHIKLDYEEAAISKRWLLFSEMSALKTAKSVEMYGLLRLEELELRNKMYMKMKEVRSNIKKIQNILPTPSLPKILKRERIMEKEMAEPEKKKTPTLQASDIDSQLREIQRRLWALQER